MTAAAPSLPRLIAASAGALLLVLCTAGQAQAAASGSCTSNAPDPGSTMTITINSGMAPAATTIAVAGEVVTIDTAPQAACAGLDAIIVNGDGGANAVTFTGSESFTVSGDLGAGDDEFTTVGSQRADIDGGADADTLRGGDGNDTLSGGEGADVLQGGPGTDTLNGDGGADTASYAERVTDVAVSVMGGGEDALVSVENLTGGGGDDILTGDDGDNDLDGGGGDDVLRPGLGGGAIRGGTHGTAGGAHGAAGDTVSYAGVAGDLVVEVAGGPGSATGAGLSQTLATIENATGGDGDDTLTGDAGANVLVGGAGDDLLLPRAGGGSNTGGTHGTAGGAHDADGDTVSYAGVGDDLSVDLGPPGTATGTGVSQSLATVENLRGGGGDDVLAGDGGANDLDGGGGDDLLRPRAGGGSNSGGTHGTPGGAHGGDGDTVSYGGVAEDLVLNIAAVPGTAAGTGISQALTGVENLTGGGGDDTLTGDDGDNDLDGGGGDDLLLPGLGGGAITGGPHGTAGGAHGAAGDTISYASLPAPVAVEANLGTGMATVDGVAQTLATAEHLTGGPGADVLTGSGDPNVLRGAGGADELSGLGADDLLMPGSGAGAADGGSDADTISYADVTPPAAPAVSVQASLAAGTATVAGVAQTLANAESLTGSAGDDLLAGDDGDNVLTGGGGEDTVSYADRTAGEPVTASLPTGSGGQDGTPERDDLDSIENLTGGAGDDTLTGDASANDLRGLAGDDVLSGGAADDVLLPGLGGGSSTGGTHGATGDTVSFEDLTSVPVAASLATGTATLLDPGVDPNPVHTLVEVENLTGGGAGDTLAGDDGDNVLAGGTGSDTVSYADRTAAEPVTASLPTGSGGQDGTPEDDDLDSIENLTGGDGADTLTGDGGRNVLRGAAGADILSGGGGDDLLLPGLGGGTANGNGAIDTISYADIAPAALGVTVQASLAAGTAIVAGVAQTLANAEHLTGSAGDDVLAGDDDDNTLTGGAGEDTVAYADRSAGEDVVASLATLSGGQAGEDDTFASIENLTGGAGDDTLIGDAGANDLDGGGGDDLLRPGLGDGASTGGTDGTAGGAHGDDGDTVSYGDVSADVSADLLAGTASGSGLAQTLATVENLTGGAGDDTLIGDAGANDLDGGAGDDVLRPGSGGGTNSGGAHGTAGGAHDADGDTVSFAGLAAPLLIDLGAGSATGSGVAQTLAMLENATGGSGDDTLIGDTDANRLDGGDGDDLLRPNSGGGANTGGAHGANGDTVSYVDVGTAPVQARLSGIATTGGDTQTLATIENLTGAGGADTLTGDDADNVIDGAGANDTLAGGAGADLLSGGPGTGDTVSYSTNGPPQGVTVTLDGRADDGATPGGEGDNVVGIENVTGGAGADRLHGSQAANTIHGRGGDDLVIGGGGNDTLDGGGGSADTVSYEERAAGEGVVVSLAGGGGGVPGEADSLTGFERLVGGAGNDQLSGSGGHDVLVGLGGADVLAGAGGNDTLLGMDGPDALYGGDGFDSIAGGEGDDRLDGGPASDIYDAGAGDDDLNAYDGIAENVVCGDGFDRVSHDLGDAFSNGDCEARVLLGFVPPPFVLDPRPRDRDRDGVFDGIDCNDLDPAIRPGAPEVPGNAIDENCDGADAPFPLIATEFRWSFSKVRRGTRVRVFELRKVPAGARIDVRCKSKRAPRCAFAKRGRSIPSRRRKVSVRGYFGDRPLSPGTTIEIRVSAPRTVGRTISFTMRRDRRKPRPRRGCLPPGATRAVPCP